MEDKAVSIAFAVHNVPPTAADARYPKAELRSLFEPFCRIQGSPLSTLAVDQTPKQPVYLHDIKKLGLNNGLTAACVYAWNNHYNLELSPDTIWISIAQGLAAHVNANAEKLRPLFVSHEGKETIRLDNRDFKYGDIDAHFAGKGDFKWQDAIRDFSGEIGERTRGSVRELVECDFSTTGLVERTVSQIALMETLQPYFVYDMTCICGIPKIKLMGTVEDWKKIRAKAEALAAYDLDWWLAELLPVLDHFVTAREKQPDVSFWRRICRQDGGTGTAYNRTPEFVSGWLSVFFPYDNRNQPRELRWKIPKRQLSLWCWTNDPEAAKDQSKEFSLRIHNRCIPSSVSSAPIKIHSPSGEMSLKLFGGLVGVEQDPTTLTLKPCVAWCVAGRMGADLTAE